MAIQVSGVNVIDDERNLNVGVLTATNLDVPPQVITFSPADAASGVLVGSNIVLTFSVPISKGTGNILLNKGSAGGTTHETIDVTSGNVTISGSQVTINPSSDLPTGNDIYVVVPADAFKGTALNSGNEVINTYNFSTGPILPTAFSPADAATGVAVDSNIVITFSENIAKGSGNINIRSGGASGTILQSIDVTSGAVSVSGTQATINPSSDLAYETDQYIVVDAGCFLNAAEDANSANAVINTYNFTTEAEVSPGDEMEGGNLLCKASNNYWIVAPASSEVRRHWNSRNDAVVCANNIASCGDWFIPSCSQLKNPGYACRAYWYHAPGYVGDYWSNCCAPGIHAISVHFNYYGIGRNIYRTAPFRVRAFRCVTY